MASVGTINTVGSTTYVTGLSGLDTSSLIQASVNAVLAQADTLELRIDENDLKIAAYEDLDEKLTDLQEALEALSGLGDTSSFEESEAYLSGVDNVEDLLAVSVDDSVPEGYYSLEIVQLALPQKVASEAQEDATAALGLEGGFTLAAEGYDGAAIAVDADTSIQDLADAINDASAQTGVSAVIVNSGSNGAYLVLSSVDTGIEISVTDVTGDDVLGSLGVTADGELANVLQEAQSAVVIFDGVEVASTSNQIDDLIGGMSIDLYAAAPGETITIEVAQDLGSVKDAILEMVDAYNSLRDFIITQQATDSDGVAAEDAVLFGDSVLRSAMTAVYEALSITTTDSDGNVFGIEALGLSYQWDNTLEVDEEVLDAWLLDDPDAIRSLFSLTSSTSLSDLTLVEAGSSSLDGDFEIDIVTDTDGTILSASIGGTALEVSGTLVKGADGTAYEGLELKYTGTDSATITLSLSQGIASRMADQITAYVEDDGRIDARIDSLEASNETLSDRADRITETAEQLEQRLIAKYAAIEAELAAANLILKQLEALVSGDD